MTSQLINNLEEKVLVGAELALEEAKRLAQLEEIDLYHFEERDLEQAAEAVIKIGRELRVI